MNVLKTPIIIAILLVSSLVISSCSNTQRCPLNNDWSIITVSCRSSLHWEKGNRTTLVYSIEKDKDQYTLTESSVAVHLGISYFKELGKISKKDIDSLLPIISDICDRATCYKFPDPSLNVFEIIKLGLPFQLGISGNCYSIKYISEKDTLYIFKHLFSSIRKIASEMQPIVPVEGEYPEYGDKNIKLNEEFLDKNEPK
ncbi:hypothetical protein QET93_012300 [Akkermansia sp. N21116]|uniref:hypothetical protein n=1 Tax=Akkermansia sp. N21116 TaxID=3040764 RepID=UPI00244EE3C9|nr:hypothetical protein [Akkermansia sp. N21116]WPX40307.1 hypothetical protein QET93_012300 [Akkermansia sp. N21116]